jgi:hypothetical protein
MGQGTSDCGVDLNHCGRLTAIAQPEVSAIFTTDRIYEQGTRPWQVKLQRLKPVLWEPIRILTLALRHMGYLSKPGFTKSRNVFIYAGGTSDHGIWSIFSRSNCDLRHPALFLPLRFKQTATQQSQ